jgi:L-2-hydroxyglutarate oxidase LhgO
MDKVEAVVVGAGVVGLAVARALAQRGHEVVVLEAANAIGTGTSSRNSEVIHAGLYYEPGSSKAQYCVAGKHLLYAFCETHGVAHRRCGKLIVATSDSQRDALARIAARAIANGVTDLQWLSAAEAQALEPALACTAALLSPSTGIVDSHGLMLALQGDIEAASGSLALASPVVSMTVGDEIVIEVGGEAPMQLAARLVVNAAGLWAPALAARMIGLPPACVPQAYFAKGNYFSLAGRAPFSHLVYPVPEQSGLGVHLTLDLAGQARFGPDVEWIEPEADGRFDYRVDASRCAGFANEIRRYWPGMPDDALAPAYSGVRPKLGPAGTAAADFVVQGAGAHGIAGLVNLFGIESPGLTASLALAEAVADLLGA